MIDITLSKSEAVRNFVGYEDAAQLLGVKTSTLYAWVHQRRIPHIRIGRRCVRFDQKKLQAFLDERAVQVAADGGAA